MSASRSSIVLTLLACFVPLSLALNLFNFFWMDGVFAIVTIISFCFSEKSWAGIRNTFGFTNKFLLTCLAAYLGSGIMGYFLNSPMQMHEWNKIASLRWIWGFFACHAVGHLLAEKSKKFNWSFTALIGILGWIIYRQYNMTAGDFITPDHRLQGFYSNPNYFALALVLVWAMVLSFVLYSNDCPSRTSATLALVLATIALIATYTRTSWIGMICTLVVALFYTRNKKAIAISGLTLAVFAAAVALNVFELKDRILYTFDFSGVNSQIARLTIWKVSWQVFLDHPLFGVGFENAAKLFPSYYVKMGHANEYVVGHAHNQFLDTLAGAGIFGLAGYLGAFGGGAVFFYHKLKYSAELHKKQLALGSILCIVALFACSWTETPFIQHEVRNFILILLGFSYGYLAGKPQQQTTL
ncbi:O-antigen ligase family protein [Bdellovibrio bacteriovorus]|uniref:Putative O-antigen ligase WaaL n=1 Tax=Bdellovibrio bacteriovorus str. Tiberius TaxID=1069642 RepID=K7Z9V7_BDEBC|nr:O-antigen ligase family protein [Bdellovibrio bacteriovorus]AFY01359.1 putative O-antigen ligase WaaL [Bdellovibrio bacteriovorus str. Tiberius]